ncbi:hypothetical protein QT711_03555 [Sporosarcina saromensis]|uniref:Uncharacterized protein n=1 Tax=Sporosarcina saromensis TaxID=359365 RepID=A0ABU4G7A5_9BACL|nr:hypothetical protein [Sporosarcina saromensis]MDW0112247.1 hypothetical protein [Sporosarcina saromensis]
MSNLYEIIDGTGVKMSAERIDLHKSGYFNNKDVIIDENGTVNSYSIQEIQSAKSESAAGNYESSSKEVSNLEITPKEYIDDRVTALEKSMDHKIDAQGKLLSEKIDHLHTKFEGSLETKFNSFKTEILKEDKESRRFLITTILTSIGIATATIIGVLGFLIK